jgi:FMN phosphatase YigB (HAD superfamily)
MVEDNFEIQNLIFDWGGVISKPQFISRIIYWLSKKYEINREKMYNIITLYVRLKITEEELFEKLKEENIEKDYFMECIKKSNVINKKMQRLIKMLSEDYNLYILSDNPKISSEIIKENKEFLNLFVASFFSYERNMTKENNDFFELIFNRERLSKNTTIFIDNDYRNIKRAKDLGIKCYHFIDEDLFEKDFIDMKIL